ncbi:MAG: 16S rRNA (cytosine(1402)-N(4))-methyltransferase RsmH [Proteobacteria bacterium]|nr:16S rRNA (cytosine(1402)-N(4))-methyltransferase RsmH [Pseudomonadota bacterium]MBU4294943.1 16S rRNA (cytosine(1402)-N(4))-methyltransferase RsmH [Pseudomonadota bacterium]MCG2747951.1 16S rRNA (cytosine(1402)-N(4))-methyltransferase RsmH [Desulfobulbaceae bacterium]
MRTKPVHLPVLLDEVIHYLAPQDGGLYVDGNLGIGGHSGAILEASGPGGRVIGFDWDEDALARARVNLAGYQGRVEFVRRNFAEISEVLPDLGVGRVDGLLLDLGLSSLQLDVSGRGFTFQGSEPLDMRMDVRSMETAADLLNRASEQELADIFYLYGEERQARRIASFVVDVRRKTPLATTDQLVKIVENAVPRRFWPKKIHVATKVFQALRIAVNRELDNLEKILESVADIVKPGGRICVISFHSLEDRLVKRTFRNNPALELVTAKAVTAADVEILANPRSRSARLRVAAVRGQ